MRAVEVRRCLRCRQGGSDFVNEADGGGEDCGDVEGSTELEDVLVMLFCREVRGTRWILPANENLLVGLDRCQLGRPGYHTEMDHNQMYHKRGGLH